MPDKVVSIFRKKKEDEVEKKSPTASETDFENLVKKNKEKEERVKSQRNKANKKIIHDTKKPK